MGKIHQPYSPNSLGFDSPLYTPDGQSRSMFARGQSMHFFRSSSMPRLFPSPLMALNRENSVVFGNDSCAQMKIDFSHVPLDQEEEEVVALLKEISQAIHEQTVRKTNVEKQMSENFKLAKARYLSGSRMGAILSMRKAHKSKAIKAYIAAARFRLIDLRKQVEALIRRSEYELDVSDQRSIMKSILTELTVAKSPMPNDEDLLGQLRRSILVESKKSAPPSS